MADKIACSRQRSATAVRPIFSEAPARAVDFVWSSAPSAVINRSNDNRGVYPRPWRSEERRVGKECVIRVDRGGRRIINKKQKTKHRKRSRKTKPTTTLKMTSIRRHKNRTWRLQKV